MYGLSISFLSEQPTSPPHATHPGPKLCHEIFLHFPFLKAQHWDKCMGQWAQFKFKPYCSVRKFSSLWACFYHVTKKEQLHHFHLSLPQSCSSWILDILEDGTIIHCFITFRPRNHSVPPSFSNSSKSNCSQSYNDFCLLKRVSDCSPFPLVPIFFQLDYFHSPLAGLTASSLSPLQSAVHITYMSLCRPFACP